MPKKDEEKKTKGKNKDKKQGKESPRRSPRIKAKDNEEKKGKGRKSKNSSPNKEEKKVKDPAAPKKAHSSYIIYANEHRAKVMEENPGKKIGEIGKILGDMWNGLSEKEKKKYKKLHEEAKAK